MKDDIENRDANKSLYPLPQDAVYDLQIGLQKSLGHKAAKDIHSFHLILGRSNPYKDKKSNLFRTSIS